jgi:NADH dehydrogenase
VEAAGAVPIHVDIRDAATTGRAVRGARVVIDLVTITRERRSGDFAAVQFGGTGNIVRAAREARVQRVVAVGVLVEPHAGADRRRPYLYWKQRATDLLRSSGLDPVIFETSILFGPGDQLLTATALALKWLPVLPIGGRAAARTRFQPLGVKDLVTCLLQATDTSAVPPGVYRLGGPEVFTYADLVTLIDRCLHTRRKIIIVPSWSIRPLLGAAACLSRRWPIPGTFLDLAGVDSVGESSATYDRFGLDPMRLADGMGYLRDVGYRNLHTWGLG